MDPSLLQRLDHERRHLARDGEILEVLDDVTRFHSVDGSHHSVVFSSLSEQTADAVIAREIAHYRALNAGFEWKLYAHDQPPDLLARLQRSGFEIGGCEAVLVRELETPELIDEQRPTIRVERIERESQIADFRRVAEEVFRRDYSFTSNELAEALRNRSTQHRGYIAYEADQPVSIGRLYTHPNSLFGGLFGGGTIASHRGRGFYRAVIAARAREAAALGARYLLVDAMPTSRPILQRLGFQHLTDTWPCDWKP
jgi:hypothetical protein